MANVFALALIAGTTSGLLFVSVGHFGLIAIALPYFSMLPLMIIGLARGFYSVVYAATFSILLVLITDGYVVGSIYLLAIGLPAGLITRQALLSRKENQQVKWYPVGRLLVCIAALVCSYFAVAFILLSNNGTGMENYIEQILWNSAGFVVDDLSGRDGERFVRSLAYTFPSIVSILWGIMVVANTLLAQGFLVRCDVSIRPPFKISETTLPFYLAIPFGVAIIASFMPSTVGFLGASLAAMLSMPYFFLGLAVIHVISRTWPLRGLVLGLVYVVVGLSWLSLEVWAALFVVTLGVLEQWVGIRTRFSAWNNHSNNPLV